MITIKKIPKVHSLIARCLAENGGSFQGTNRLCESILADPRDVRYSLQRADKYQLIRRSKTGHCGRGHKSIWRLTRNGQKYVQSL
jgi:hypothetical protein